MKSTDRTRRTSLVSIDERNTNGGSPEDCVDLKASLMVVQVTSIVWDTDSEDVELPAVWSIEWPVDDPPDDEAIADFLSDEFGWLVESFQWAILRTIRHGADASDENEAR